MTYKFHTIRGGSVTEIVPKAEAFVQNRMVAQWQIVNDGHRNGALVMIIAYVDADPIEPWNFEQKVNVADSIQLQITGS